MSWVASHKVNKPTNLIRANSSGRAPAIRCDHVGMQAGNGTAHLDTLMKGGRSLVINNRRLYGLQAVQKQRKGVETSLWL